MKKLLIVAGFILSSFVAHASTDPFFLLSKDKKMLDTDVTANINWDGSNLDYFQIKECFRMGLGSGVDVGASIGLARVRGGGVSDNGITDPELFAKWRALDRIDGRYNLDLSALISPSLFDSPFDYNPNGAAKGSTDFSVKALFGKQGSAAGSDPLSLGVYFGLDFVGSTDTSGSATDILLGTVGKYYVDSLNSIDGEVGLALRDRRIDGGDRDNGFRVLGGYTRELADNLELGGYGGFETHDSSGAKTEILFGARFEYLF